MRTHLISFAQVIKILQNIKLKGGVNPKTPPLRTPLDRAEKANKCNIKSEHKLRPIKTWKNVYPK